MNLRRLWIRPLYRVSNVLERAGWMLGELAWKLRFCEDCGRNKYTGAPCKT